MTDYVIELFPTGGSPFVPEGPVIDVVPIVPKKSYSRDWPAYDMAKTNEDVFFKRLLQELLLLGVEDDPAIKIGRKGFSVRDKLFCMAIKTYYKSDLRKCESILKELRNLRYIASVPCFKSIDNFFNDKKLSEILDRLILISGIPLAGLEETGAIDSTGFSTSQFERWFTYKWGKHEGKERIWRKAHACVGCKTNVFLSIKVTEKNVADAPMFEEVVGNHPRFFEMKSFVADKAYLSREILKFIQNLGLTPYIPFKSNSRGNPLGYSIWRKMFDEYTYKREEFMSKYHQRSNVESCFHMIKQRFGNHLMTKTFVANTNEIKVKALCHNLCVLIQEAYENKINIDFDACVKKTEAV